MCFRNLVEESAFILCSLQDFDGGSGYGPCGGGSHILNPEFAVLVLEIGGFLYEC